MAALFFMDCLLQLRGLVRLPLCMVVAAFVLLMAFLILFISMLVF
ncbi:hypothetical protein [Alicyclobacillus acidiphilus]|nr:hypothetical protein [Alicyclobacillus acidiphilus]